MGGIKVFESFPIQEFSGCSSKTLFSVHPMQVTCGDSTFASQGFFEVGDFVDSLYGQNLQIKAKCK